MKTHGWVVARAGNTVAIPFVQLFPIPDAEVLMFARKSVYTSLKEARTEMHRMRKHMIYGSLEIWEVW